MYAISLYVSSLASFFIQKKKKENEMITRQEIKICTRNTAITIRLIVRGWRGKKTHFRESDSIPNAIVMEIRACSRPSVKFIGSKRVSQNDVKAG